jgi:hypothetical protein
MDNDGCTSVVIIESILENLPNGIHVYSFEKMIDILVSEKEYVNAEASIYSVTGGKFACRKMKYGKNRDRFFEVYKLCLYG